MAIDSALKRASAIQFKQVYRMTMPFPTGTITIAQRLLLAYEYGGIQPAPPSNTFFGIFSSPMDMSIFRILGGIFNLTGSVVQT